MAGDPCQLPPVVAAPAAVTPGAAPMGTASAAVAPASAAVVVPCAAVGPPTAAVRLPSTAGGPGTASALQLRSQQGLAGGSAAAANSPATGVGLQGLARPLLVRLIQMGHKAHLLRTQYRQSSIHVSLACHQLTPTAKEHRRAAEQQRCCNTVCLALLHKACSLYCADWASAAANFGHYGCSTVHRRCLLDQCTNTVWHNSV